MKYLKILSGFLLCSLSKNGISQQHFTNTWSVSTGILINTKGGSATIHYHLNSFDELRLNFYRTKETDLFLKTNSLSLEFSKGYKFRGLQKVTTYFGMGFFWGKEAIKEETLPVNNLFGISTFQETEYAPFNWGALFIRIKRLIPFQLARGKPWRLTFGSRFYF